MTNGMNNDLVRLGCYKKKYKKTGWFINNRNVSLIVLEAGKSKIKVLADAVSGENLCLVIDDHLFLVSSHGRRGKGALWDLLYKGTNPIHEGSAHMN